jgi:hypothetical protein
MGDNTGAPWNIPYVEPSDLVRDYPAADEAQALAIAAGLSAAGNAGIGDNTVQAVKTDVFTLASNTYTDVTGLTVTITPTSATSKVLLIGQIALGNSSNTAVTTAAFYRGTTQLTAYFGDITGSLANGFHSHAPGNSGNNERTMSHGTGVFIDSPGVATAVTYTIRVRRWNGGTAYVGGAGTEPVAASAARLPSSLTAIEVKV